jgi:hypothetical protein
MIPMSTYFNHEFFFKFTSDKRAGFSLITRDLDVFLDVNCWFILAEWKNKFSRHIDDYVLPRLFQILCTRYASDRIRVTLRKLVCEPHDS